MINTKLDRESIQDLTDRLLSARSSNLKMVLDIEHRLNLIGVVEGVEYINDSKSTTVNATEYSLTCMDRPVIWLLSCMDHEQELSRLRPLVNDKVRAILYLGNEDEPFIEEFVQQVDVIQCCDTMVELVTESLKLADAGEVVLFSPATSTSAEFSSYQERGTEFSEAVRSIMH